MDTSSTRRLEGSLGALLRYGTWLASSVTAIGLVLLFVSAGPALTRNALLGERVIATGVALFILLPVLRVLVMLFAFLRARELRLAAVAALVLCILALGLTFGALG